MARAASCNFRRGVTLDSDRRLGATLDSGRRSGATLPCPALFVITLQGGQGVSRPRLSRVTLDCDHPSVSPPYTKTPAVTLSSPAYNPGDGRPPSLAPGEAFPL